MIYVNTTGKHIGECLTGFGSSYPVTIYNSGNSDVEYKITVENNTDIFSVSNAELIIKEQKYESLRNKLANLSEKGLTFYYDQNHGPSVELNKGKNQNKYYTSFINIQQMTKSDEFAGSNRLKHMMEAFCKIERSRDGLERSMHFEKNRDCDKDFKVYFSIYQDGVHYSYEMEKED